MKFKLEFPKWFKGAIMKMDDNKMCGRFEFVSIFLVSTNRPILIRSFSIFGMLS